MAFAFPPNVARRHNFNKSGNIFPLLDTIYGGHSALSYRWLYFWDIVSVLKSGNGNFAWLDFEAN